MNQLKESEIPISRRRLIYEYVFRPLSWGTGSALLAWIGFVEVGIIWAFIVGLIVGIVHDGVLYGMGVITYRRKVETIHVISMFTEATNHYEAQNWNEALEILMEIHQYAPGYKDGHYLALRCYEKLEDWSSLILLGDEYLDRYPLDSEISALVQHAYTQRA
ncbi:MAG: hypothetical protein GF411_05205 [Candidatus Lokiarchaeota archaeon]|nr:hypothetical protein [Candidatus Lokiarchaeota archaeon]